MARKILMSIFEFDSNPLIFESRFYVTGLFNHYLPANCKFHTIHHTLNVVQFCYELGEHYRLTKTDMEKLLLAAWFHDTGYCLNIDDHENASVTIVSTFLDSRNLTENYLPSVKKLILATKRLGEPVTLAEQIICDADAQHLGAEDYFNWCALLKEELELKNCQELSDKEWSQMNICFFDSHRYFTDYAQKMWGGQKLKNLNLLKAGK
ncbi:MAG: HD domain-containing protein [Cyclobacteriaceae bacterium]|nr:HD domain-containing protein [Cyclobacteriaceae bacterium]